MTIFDDNFRWQFLMKIFEKFQNFEEKNWIFGNVSDFGNFGTEFLHFLHKRKLFSSKGSSLSWLPRKVVPFLWSAQLQPFGNKKNIFSSPSLKRFWNGKDVHDVPLVCKDDRTKQTHKRILAASKTKHSLQLHKTTNMDGCIVKGQIFSSNFLFNIFCQRPITLV